MMKREDYLRRNDTDVKNEWDAYKNMSNRNCENA